MAQAFDPRQSARPPPVNIAALPAARPALSSGAVPEGTKSVAAGTAPPAASKRPSIIPQFKDNPIAALGLILSEVAAGLKGQPSPVAALQARQTQQSLHDIKLLKTAVEGLKTGIEIAKSLPPDQLDAFIKQYARNFENAGIVDFGETLAAAVADKNPERIAKIIEALEENAEFVAIVCGTNQACWIDYATDDKKIAFLNERTDAKNLETIPAKMGAIMDALNAFDVAEFSKTVDDPAGFEQELADLPRDQEGNLSLTSKDFTTLNGFMDKDVRLTPSELGTVKRNPEILRAHGIVTAEEQKIEAGEAAKLRGKGGKKREIKQDRNDISRFVDTGQPVFPNVEEKKARPATAEEREAIGAHEDTIVFFQPNGTLVLKNKPTSDETVRDEKIKALTDMGVTDNKAVKITDGLIRIEIVPRTGRARLIDEVTGTVEEISLGTTKPTKTAPKGMTLFEMAMTGRVAGVGPALVEFGARTVGQIPGIDFGEVTTRIRQEVRTAGNELIRALSINPRFPVAEQERIREEINIAPRAMDTQESLLARMKAVDTQLRRRLENEKATADDPNMPDKARGEAAQAGRAIENFLNALGVPQTENIESMSLEELNVLALQINSLTPEEKKRAEKRYDELVASNAG